MIIIGIVLSIVGLGFLCWLLFTLAVYALSGLLAGVAGAILAAQFGAGQPNEGVGWELFAISAVVLGGTLLTGGQGSIAMTMAGVALLGMPFVLTYTATIYWVFRGKVQIGKFKLLYLVAGNE